MNILRYAAIIYRRLRLYIFYVLPACAEPVSSLICYVTICRAMRHEYYLPLILLMPDAADACRFLSLCRFRYACFHAYAHDYHYDCHC